MEKTVITTSIEINIPIEKAWQIWNNPDDIIQWNNADQHWENQKVENDPHPGGKFLYEMRKKDGSDNFDFEGTYDEVIPHQLMNYTLTDGRQTKLIFEGSNPVTLTEIFDAEPNLPVDMQKEFCQAVHKNFKNYAEQKA